MKIAILNNSSLKSQHLNSLGKIGHVKIFNRTIGEKLAIQRLKNIDIAIIDSYDIPLSNFFFESLPDLKFICLNSTGYEQVDLESAKKNSVLISNVQDYATHSVAELTIGLIICLNRKLNIICKQISINPFEIELSDTTNEPFIGHELYNKKLGIIGFGNIGKQVAKIATAFGMKVFVLSYKNQKSEYYHSVELDTILSECDFISLNNSSKESSELLLDEKVIAKVKPNSFIINTARGNLVDENMILKAIESKSIGGYATDVLTDNSINNPMLKYDNVIITPHIGFYTNEALCNLANNIVANVVAFASNKPINLITKN